MTKKVLSIFGLAFGSALLAGALFQSFAIVQALVQPQTTPTPTMSPRPTTSPKPSPTQSPKPMSSPKAGAVSTADHTFLQAAAQGGEAEVTLAKYATEHAKDSRVKDFATTLDNDHTKANKELEELAGKKTFHLTTAPTSTQRATQSRLEKLQGPAFDKAYITEMVHDHQKDVADFEKVAKTASDPDVKAFAEQTLPTLKAHLTQALELQKEIK